MPANGKQITLWRAKFRQAVMPALIACVFATPASAFNDPDWPCVQRKVVALSPGQIWTAPLPPDDSSWRKDADISHLVPILAARRTSLDEAEALIGEFAEGADDARLTLLFGGLFQTVEQERRRLIDGIERYARKQRSLSERIDAEQVEIATLRSETSENDFDTLDKLEEREDQLLWDTRIYQDRNKSLTYVCESPVIIEKRAFAISRMIQARLSQ